MNTRTTIAELAGIYPAMLTPFKNGKVDLNSAAAHLVRMLDGGADGAYVCGSSGEMLAMTTEERMSMIEVTTDAAKGKGKIIAHVGCTDLAAACTMAKHAEACGAAAVAAIPPIYYKVSFEAQCRWMETLCAATSLPVLYYNIPASTGVSLTAEQMNTLFAIDGVAGMKFTDNAFFMLEQVAAANPEALLYNGYDEMLLAGLAMGANGYIGTSGNLMSPALRALFTRFFGGDVRGAQQIQRTLNAVIAAALPYGVIPAFKAMGDALGYDLGEARAPQLNLDLEQKRAIERDILPLVVALNESCR